MKLAVLRMAEPLDAEMGRRAAHCFSHENTGEPWERRRVLVLRSLSRRKRKDLKKRDHHRQRSCVSKVRFPSLERAERSADYQRRRYRATMEIYECGYCDGWHLSSGNSGWRVRQAS